MRNKLLLFDGSNHSEHSQEHLTDILNMQVDLVFSENGALDMLSSNEYIALLAEPMTYFTRAKSRQGFKDFLGSIRDIPVIVYSTQSKNIIISEFGLVMGTHYDSYVSKLSAKEKDDLTSIIELHYRP